MSQVQKSPFNVQTEYSNGYNPNSVIFELETSRAIFFTHLTIKVYANRVSLENRPFIGSWEHRETFSAMDVGNIYINKGRRRAVVGAYRANSTESLFEIKGLFHNEAEDLKDALDELIGYRLTNATYFSASA